MENKDDIPPIKQFLQHESEFMGYLMAMTRDFQAAEEIFQNAAVVVMEYKDTEKGEKEVIRNFRAWAKEVVRRQALYYLRQQRKAKPTDPVLLDQITQAFVEDESSQEHRKSELVALRQCVQKLNKPHRDMVTMRYEGRKSFEKIGELVGRTASAVQRTISRARKSLHDCIQTQMADESETPLGLSGDRL